MKYIQRKDRFGLETVDQFQKYSEAVKMLREYKISDRTAEYYISSRACKEWRK